MNTKMILAAVAIVAAFAAVVGPVSIANPALAQNMTGDNMTAGGGNMTGGNMTDMTGMGGDASSPPPTP